MLSGYWFQTAQEIRQEHRQLRSFSYRALQNMLGYCRARVDQLSDHRKHLDFMARQEHDLHELLITCDRMGRANSNYQRFAEKCLLIELELTRREEAPLFRLQEGKRYEA